MDILVYCPGALLMMLRSACNPPSLFRNLMSATGKKDQHSVFPACSCCGCFSMMHRRLRTPALVSNLVIQNPFMCAVDGQVWAQNGVGCSAHQTPHSM